MNLDLPDLDKEHHIKEIKELILHMSKRFQEAMEIIYFQISNLDIIEERIKELEK